MIDQLAKLVQQNAGDSIVRNPAIPDQQNDAAIHDVAENIVGGLQSHASQGNTQDIMSMFQGGDSSTNPGNPVVSQLIGKVAGSLAAKFGVSPQTAQQIAASILPKVMGQFVNKTKDPNDHDFDLKDVLGKFTGNSNIGDVLGKLGGGAGSDSGGMFGKMFK